MAERCTLVGVWHSACRVAQVTGSGVTVRGQYPQTGGTGSWNLPNTPCFPCYSTVLSLLSSFNLSSFPFLTWLWMDRGVSPTRMFYQCMLQKGLSYLWYLVYFGAYSLWLAALNSFLKEKSNSRQLPTHKQLIIRCKHFLYLANTDAIWCPKYSWQ